jgi:hypothetical protein
MQCPFRKSSLVKLVSDSAYSMLHPGPDIYNSVNALLNSAQRRASIYLFFGSDTLPCAEYLRPSQRLLKSSAATASGRRRTLYKVLIYSPLCLLGGHLAHRHCRRRDCKEPWAFEHSMVPITDHSHADREVIWPEHLRRSERLRCTDWGPTDTCELYLCLAWAASTHSILPNSLGHPRFVDQFRHDKTVGRQSCCVVRCKVKSVRGRRAVPQSMVLERRAVCSQRAITQL